MYCGYVVKIENIRKHANADRLQIATFFGSDTVVDLTPQAGDIGIYFPVDGQLSEEMCQANDLVRRKNEDGSSAGGFLEPGKRNIKAINLRGEKSDGLYLPLSSLEWTSADLSEFKVGDVIDVVNGHEICRKYIPTVKPRNKTGSSGIGKKKSKYPVAPLFLEHIDTQQLAYNLGAFKPGDLIEVTEKLHGTSQRTGYLPKLIKIKRNLLDRLLGRPGKPVYDWGYVSGTRRTVLENYDGGFYGSNDFREEHSKVFEDRLRKGETCYAEVVGWVNTDTPIMGECKNSKLNDKEFVKKYGDTTIFTYGCDAPDSDLYVYRMNLTNEDGDVVEYTPDFMRYRCEQMGIKTVPVLWKGYIPEDVDNAGEWVAKLVEPMVEGSSTIDARHIREGVVVRILNRPSFTALKSKSFSFKCLEGILKSEASTPDMEEAEEVLDSV